MKSDFRFHYTLRVRFAETDAQGIVFNGNYLTYFDVAWTEYFRAMGMSYKDILDTGIDMVLAKTTIEFKIPAHFDELLEIHTRISAMGNSSITFEFEVHPEGAERVMTKGTSIYVCIDPATLKPRRVPETLRARCGEFEGKDFRCTARRSGC